MLKIFKNKYAVLAFMGIVLSSCTTLTKQNADWVYKEDGIKLNITAPEDLNNYENQAHMLSMAVIQVSSTNKYSNLLQTQSGVSSALANTATFDEQTGFERYYIKPNEEKTLSLAREKGTEYVFLVFGYAGAKPEDTTKMVAIPFDGGWWGDGPLDLDISVKLGTNGIDTIQNGEEDNGFF